VANGKRSRKKRCAYKPVVEAMEALRLLSSAAQALPELSVEGDELPPASSRAPASPPVHVPTWDAALVQTQLADILGTEQTDTDAETVAEGLSQLNRYLSRAWYRAGVPSQLHDDSSQAVYVALLRNLGRDRFDSLVNDIGRVGIRDVLSRETPDGPDFFRAIDMVKKRAQRERSFVPIEALEVSSSSPYEVSLSERRNALEEAIDRSLSPREAALMHATLEGETPAEIASRWGVAPKTVSNEKTRVIQKLRGILAAEIVN
jgi:RNA polymerase sigma factor (sigma-70 family)